MSPLLLDIAAGLCFSIGIAHSYLGERYIIVRLLRRDLPKLFGDDWFTRRTLRFAWHVTTIAWWGLAAVLLVAGRGHDGRSVVLAVGATFLVSALVSGLASRGRHLSWIVFLAIAVLCYFGAQ